MALTTTDAGEPAGKEPRKSQTVGESLDEAIAHARKQVESLCIKKAKCEALNILDHPMDFYREMVYPY